MGHPSAKVVHNFVGLEGVGCVCHNPKSKKVSKKNLLVSKKFVILLLFHFDNAKIIQIFEIPKFFDEKNHEKMIFFS